MGEANMSDGKSEGFTKRMSEASNTSGECNVCKYGISISPEEIRFVDLVGEVSPRNKCCNCDRMTYYKCKLCPDRTITLDVMELINHVSMHFRRENDMRPSYMDEIWNWTTDAYILIKKNFPYVVLLSPTTNRREFLRCLVSLSEDVDDDEKIDDELSEECLCLICGDQYETFPTFDVMREHVMRCASFGRSARSVGV
jgi:hypothetical protein